MRVATSPPRFTLTRQHIIHTFFHLIFWVWNLTFIGVMYIWMLPQAGFEIIRAANAGDIEPTFFVSFTALMVVPLVCTLLGFFKLRRYPVQLMRLFYGVEAPLFTLCLLRLFLIRELTWASAFTLALVVVAIAMFAIEILSGYAAYRPRLATVQMVSHSLMLLVGLYVGALLLLYSIPLLLSVGGELVRAFFGFGWLSVPQGFSLIEVSVMLLFFGSVAVFFSLPYVFTGFYIKAWLRIQQAFAHQFSKEKSWTITGVTAAVSILLFIALQGQPQVKAFRLLAAPPSEVANNPTELVSYRQTQLDNADAIKAGLTNAYLFRYRYLGAWSESNALANIYGEVLKLPRGGQQFFQNIHNALISPFLYRGTNEDIEAAKVGYEQFFDEPIQKGEIAAVRRSLQATANRDETKAGLLNLDQKVVRLASQNVSVTEQGDWATVEIHEQYENATLEDQEIFYAFSLPESATITGLWLGNAANPKQFPFVVSPRGAAQQVYNGEVERAKFQRATDPALLEQVGPRQYRLRVFPIPAAEFNDSVASSVKPTAGELHLWMTYEVMQQGGQWPLPQLTEKRNIFWTEDTQHLRGRNSIALTEDEWFEAAIPAKRSAPKRHTVQLAEGYRVTATPIRNQGAALFDRVIAVVIDSSYSMRTHQADLHQAKSDLQSLAKRNDVDIYLSTAESEAQQIALKDFDEEAIQFYGTLQPADMLRQFAAADDKVYDAILLLTDEGSYELATDQPELPALDLPLWVVHLGGALPSAYEDTLLQRIQANQGGVETSVEAVVQRLALDSEAAIALDNYLWKVEPTESEAADSQENPFETIAARQLIHQQTRSLGSDNVAALDAVHAIAKRTGIVTPYSSMLVLVDERQREALKAAEAGADRFEREVENGQDELTDPGSPLTASVPEPGQVLSLMVGAIALVLLKRHREKVSSEKVSSERVIR